MITKPEMVTKNTRSSIVRSSTVADITFERHDYLGISFGGIYHWLIFQMALYQSTDSVGQVPYQLMLGYSGEIYADK